MNDTVWIKHPHLDATIEVPRSALATHQRSGWEQTDPPPPPPAPDPGVDPPAKTSEAPATAGASALQQDTSPSRRRMTKGNE